MKVSETDIRALQRLSQAALAVGPAVERLSSAMAHFGAQVYAMAWDAYLMAGAPYGETRKGLKRWLAERQDAEATGN